MLYSIIKKTFGVILLAFALFTLVAIYGFSARDQSMLHISSSIVENVAGKYGAYIADPILQAFGYGIVFPIVYLITISCKLLQNKQSKFHAIRFSILCFTLPFFSALCSFLHISNEQLLRDGGGFVGFYIKSVLSLRVEQDLGLAICVVASIFGIIFSLHINFSEWKTIAIFFAKSVHLGARASKSFFMACFAKINSKIEQSDNKQINFQQLQQLDILNKPSKQSKNLEHLNIIDLPESVPEVNVESHTKMHGDTSDYTLPHSNLLDPLVEQASKPQLTHEALESNSIMLKQVLQDFGVRGEITNIFPGPIVTLYELEPSAGTKSSRVINLSDDIARSMSAISTRIAVIPGKNAIGIELPNPKRAVVYLRELLESKEYTASHQSLPLILGKNIGGESVIADLAKMPHLLVAGTTGSGKSVAINTMILSLLYKHSPKTCRLVMIDPKMLELSVYEGIPHLIAPVVTDPKKAVSALKWVVREMEERYRAMSLLGVRNIHGYNKLISEYIAEQKEFSKQVQTGFDKEFGRPIFETVNIKNEILPYIVVIVDEMADLMLVAGKDIEAYIQRLAQMARAAGIHLIMATQRPSVDVITGVIKANFPTRISFQVTSKIDSRTILGEQGAEQLLGMGDMLYMMPGGRIERVHGPFVQDKEVEKIVDFLKAQGAADYISEDAFDDSESDKENLDNSDSGDDLYTQAVNIVLQDRKASTSYLQRCFKIGYNRAASLIERMEKEGVVSLPNHVGKREILK